MNTLNTSTVNNEKTPDKIDIKALLKGLLFFDNLCIIEKIINEDNNATGIKYIFIKSHP